MIQSIKDLKHVKIHRDKLLQELLTLQEQENILTDKIQQNRMKQSKVGFEIRDATNRICDMIEELK